MYVNGGGPSSMAARPRTVSAFQLYKARWQDKIDFSHWVCVRSLLRLPSTQLRSPNRLLCSLLSENLDRLSHCIARSACLMSIPFGRYATARIHNFVMLTCSRAQYSISSIPLLMAYDRETERVAICTREDVSVANVDWEKKLWSFGATEDIYVLETNAWSTYFVNTEHTPSMPFSIA